MAAGAVGGRKDEEKLVAIAAGGFERALGGVGEPGRAGAVGDGWGGAATEDFRAESEVEFVHQAGAEQSTVQLATTLA